ncbi:MAG TPA: hypothetical protein VJT31_16760 [Rugosimonospora sp.]|nr:hypothetical protein [Rugosimonospora sp.]
MTTPRSRAARTRRWRAAAAVTLLAAVATLVTIGVAGVLSGHGRQPGQVTVSRCTPVDDRFHGIRYSCTGSFAADDGTFRITEVTLLNDRPVQPGADVAATVSGPRDLTASPASDQQWPLYLLGGGALLLALLVLVWRWRPRGPAGHRRLGMGH